MGSDDESLLGRKKGWQSVAVCKEEVRTVSIDGRTTETAQVGSLCFVR